MGTLPSTVASQIRFLLQSLNDSNFDSVLRELTEIADLKSEDSILLLQTLLDQVKFRDGDMQLKLDVLSAIFRHLMGRPNFTTVFCVALRNTQMSEGFLMDLSKAVNLTTPEKIGVGLALSDSENLDFRMKGQNFCMTYIEELCANPAVMTSNEQIQNIFIFLSRSQGLAKYVDSFTKMLSLLQLKDGTPCVLSPMLPSDLLEVNSMRHLDLLFESKDNDFDILLQEIEAEISMADIVKELGYGCTVNSSQCKQILSLFSPLNEVTLSRIVSTVARTHTGLEDGQNTYSTFCSALGWGSATDSSLLNSWSVDVLTDSIKQLAPETNWTSVMENLDHEGFYLPDEGAFSLLMSIYKSVNEDPFPLHAVCGSVWKNAEGQLSFLRYAISAPPEIFSFAHSVRKLSSIDSQQVSKLPNGHENQAWLCLDLIDVLCQLAERGHANSVRAILENPLKQCPDLLLLGLAHISTSFNLLQHEVTSIVFPMIIGNSMRGAILQNLWSVNPYLVVHSFVDMQSVDSDNLSKVLDICKELKILSAVLDMAPFTFSIKLVALASKKDQFNLEKWLNENLTAYKDSFFEGCVKFMKEMSLYASSDGSANSMQQSGAPINAYAELMSTFLKVLQAYSGQLISHQLAEELKSLQITHVTPRLQSTGTAESTTSDGFPDDVEAEANSYFHQMFSGQLSVDAMVQMLSRFQDSPEKREQSIFECIIGNIFEEYRFYPKYPEKQLRIAAVLFGSVIKHRLVGHLTLGMALRYVLDALRKSVDSKMFVFGAKALEQFVDRLVEWPQYCNHILQISHLCGTHAELVAFIERALARISSGQTDSNGVHNGPSEQHQGLNSQENMEVSDASWQTIGVNTVQSGQQFSLPLQLQQRHQGFLDEKQKPSAATLGYTKPPMSALPGSVGSTSSDVANNQKTSSSFQAVSSQSPPSVPPVTPFPRPSRALPPSGVLRPHSSNTGFGAALNIETLVAAAERRDAQIEAPSLEIQDKISFIINNISGSNMEAKSKEFSEILKEQYYPWFAQYMVMKRASIEPNFHELYLKFLDKVNSKALNKEIVKATYENCKVLLRSELIKSSSEERSLLKNLGSWLGKFTIGRNQALRAREIDPKVLIIEAYEKGLMIAVIPFTSKILEPCQCSLAYQPPNPWTMGILGLLAEIYALPNLKMNLKFDIEVLFKNLGVDMKDVKPTSLLKDRAREIEGNPDFSTKDATQPQMLTEVDSQKDPPLPYNPAPLPFPSSPAGDAKTGPGSIVNPVHGLPQPSPTPLPFPVPQLPSPILNIGTQVIINQKLGHLKFPLQRIVSMAMERAVREIMSPVVDRSVTIAMRTTKELVLKDYAMESDDSRIFNSAHLMVASLAGSLAHVTCKEPLRAAITNHLKSLLQALSVSADILEQAVQLVTNDNLDLGCALIEQAATEKALQSIDGEIAPQLMLRRKHRDGVGSQYFDATTYSQGPFARVPEALRPKPGRLSIAQQRVYEDFVRIPWQNQPSPSSNAPQSGMPVSSGGSVNSGLSRAYVSVSGQGNSNYYPAVQVAPGVVQPLDLSPEEDPGSTQLLSTSPSRIGNTDEPKSSVPSFPATVISTEPHSLDSGAAEKDVGTLAQLSPAYSGDRSGSVSEQLLSTGDALDKYQMVAQKLDVLITKDARDADIQGVISEVPDILLRCVSRDEAALAVAQKVFKSLYENASNNMHVTSHLAILAAIRDVCKLVVKELTSWVIYSDEERKFNKDITIGLIRTELLNLAEYNVHLAKLIDGGRNKAATDFAVSLVHTLVYQETGVSVSEFYSLVDALEKLALRPGAPESLQQLVEIARNSPANQVPFPRFVIGKDDKARPSRDKKLPTSRSVPSRDDYGMTEPSTADPAGFREQVTLLFREWYRICELPGATDAACSHYISQLQQSGLLKGDDITDRFFRILMELSVGHCLASEGMNPNPMTLQNPQQGQPLSFIAVDMFTKLVVLVLKCWTVEQGASKLGLLPKILAVVVRVIQKDTEEKKASFNPRPFFRFFVNCLLDLVSPDPVFEGATLQILTAFANVLHALQPLRVPGFSFAWLELVSHRSFMPKLLTSPSQKGWPFVQRLLVDLFKFMEPYLRNAELGDAVQFLYKGTLRVLLVLLHDFPEFLCDYHFSFCDVIPPSCIQMRNVILSAFPRNMRLPDPSTPNLKIDLLAEIKQSPQILSEVDAALKAKQMKADIDEYLKTKQGPMLPSELKQKLLLPQGEVALAGTRYNVPLINSLVLYVGMQAIQQLQSKSAQTGNMDIFLAGAAMEIFQALIRDLDTEGRYLFLNAVANQLRYPNNHTHYFSFVLLYLFAEAKLEIIQEQITRVLLERLIVNRPHPWGLLITFIELIKNPRYDFWSKSFTRCAPEIEKLFESVSRSCGGAKAVDDGMVSGGI
ncbi:hypothetical protein H6P81_005208 [Aristolochia fimbriata]|uniref:CCR4-NOT transcription complex subunit 1 n=1 Tax=Aristolochia fimbriata TaxID=158543 RepID=A0AAV7EV82_ARIFI|nr:hypothetical protein H6P81_005208 [Aristolochia fimbriata]